MGNVLDKAREAGMTVLPDACIGLERFHSVVGSDATLERFFVGAWNRLAGPAVFGRTGSGGEAFRRAAWNLSSRDCH
jgi:hypothetical protein